MTRRFNSHKPWEWFVRQAQVFIRSGLEAWEDVLLLPSPAKPRGTALGLTGESVPQSQRAVLQLKGRVSELEAELAEQRHLRQQAADDSEFLRAELDELKKKREDTEKAQRSLTEIESESVGLGLRVGMLESGEGCSWAPEVRAQQVESPRSSTTQDMGTGTGRWQWGACLGDGVSEGETA